MGFFSILWFLAIVAFIVIEAGTYQLVSIWLAGGALAGLITALLGGSWNLQLIMFIVFSVLLIICTRPLVKKLLNNKIERTNADSLVGKTAVVIDKVDNINATGQAKVNGIIWTARAVDDSIIEKDTVVTIDSIQGVKLIVKK